MGMKQHVPLHAASLRILALHNELKLSAGATENELKDSIYIRLVVFAHTKQILNTSIPTHRN